MKILAITLDRAQRRRSIIPERDKWLASGASMELWKRVAPIVVPLLIIIAVTDVGYFFKEVAHARHLVFFYLLPTAFVAMLYGSVLSMIFAIDATFVTGLFLNNQTFSSYLFDPHQAGELLFFTLTALIGAKCAAEIAGQAEKHF